MPEKLIHKLFSLMYDVESAGLRNNDTQLRELHIQNMDWLKENGFLDAYYDFFLNMLNKG